MELGVYWIIYSLEHIRATETKGVTKLSYYVPTSITQVCNLLPNFHFCFRQLYLTDGFLVPTRYYRHVHMVFCLEMPSQVLVLSVASTTEPTYKATQATMDAQKMA